MTERAYMFEVVTTSRWEAEKTRSMVAVAKTEHSALVAVARQASREGRSYIGGTLPEITIRFVSSGTVVR